MMGFGPGQGDDAPREITWALRNFVRRALSHWITNNPRLSEKDSFHRETLMPHTVHIVVEVLHRSSSLSSPRSCEVCPLVAAASHSPSSSYSSSLRSGLGSCACVSFTALWFASAPALHHEVHEDRYRQPSRLTLHTTSPRCISCSFASCGLLVSPAVLPHSLAASLVSTLLAPLCLALQSSTPLSTGCFAKE